MQGALNLGDFALANGGVLNDARLSYLTFGTFDARRDNAILLISYYGGTAASYLPMIGPGRALDPDRWFILVADMFGNGQSTSPSNWAAGAAFPRITVGDNIRAQRMLLDEMGIGSLALAAGWSMGGMHALHWGIRHAERVRRILSWCGTAQCWPLNRLFLDSLEMALLTDPTPQKRDGVRAFARIYAGWAYSPDFYREELWRTLGHTSEAAFLEAWDEDHLSLDYRDLLAMLHCWRDGALPGDPAAAEALGRITARTTIVACDNDRYFTPQECEAEAMAIPGAKFHLMKSPLGHCAGAPGRCKNSSNFLESQIKDILDI